jgi:hypothetical protein
MYAVRGVYDGKNIQPKESVPVDGEYEVVITFTEPLKKTKSNILDFFGIWDKEDVDCIAEIIKERG